ncbi:MAG TPA: MDR family MFS transporter [Alphaproteobacteria bacterium]|nr:MDR family MFS transporter [Alphaproteobacteria bacterium]
MEGEPREAIPVGFSHREILVIIGGVMLGMALAGLDQTIVATALPTISVELHGIEHMSWVVSAYLLTSTAATPIYGKLSDLYGRRIMFQTAVAVFLVASVLCALAESMPQLILFRALQGLGGGGLISIAHAIIGDVIAPRERGRYNGYFTAVFALTSVAGPVLGGVFADDLTWRWVFWINLPIGLAALAISRRALVKLVRRRAVREIDYWGAVLLTAAVSELLLVTTWGGVELPWTSPSILLLVLSSLALLVVFYFRERLAREPLLPLRLFKNSVVTVSCISSFLILMMMFGAIVYLPLFLQLVGGDSASRSGLDLIPLTAAVTAGAFTSGRLITRVGRYRMLPLVGLPLAALAFGLFSTMNAHTSHLVSGFYMALLGIGIGSTMPVMLVAVQNAVELRDLGVGSSMVNFFRSMGGSFGVALLSSVLLAQLDWRISAVPGHEMLGPHPSLDLLHGHAEGIGHLPAATQALLVATVERSFQVMFLTCLGIALLAIVAAFCLRDLPLRTTTGPARGAEPPDTGL